VGASRGRGRWRVEREGASRLGLLGGGAAFIDDGWGGGGAAGGNGPPAQLSLTF
jgi:hypothetical protein